MHRRSVLLVAISSALTSVMARAQPSAAQEATPASPTDLALHPIVGAWKWKNDPLQGQPESFAIFHADGTYVEVVGKETGIGVWQPAGPHRVALTAYFQDLVPETVEVEPGRTTVQASVDLNAAGGLATVTYSVVKDTFLGYRLVDEQNLTGTLTRLSITPLPAPVAATPTP